ncbi:ATPase [Thermococcus aggregans]|uniref:ATPase n=1 Tax=Thermococcus aggregans TaxID=110163 RepID=A0A9E7MXI0_THEAG|nr:ATPase [Thermococcus aggregans]USS40728.1 ATPase [Thermococcus aggregans]
MIEVVKNDFVKSYRLQQSLEALERVRGEISEKAYERLKALLHYRLYGKEFDRSRIKEKIALAFSMGSDSTATLLILRWAGFDVVPVMVKLPQMEDVVLLRAQSYGAVFVEVPKYMEVINSQIQKRAPICGKCHSMIMEAVKNYARKNGIKIVASGDLLSFGSISIYKEEDLIKLNFPAFLALDKREAIKILDRKYTLGFGCSLWKSATKTAPILKRFGIQRVLRELRAGAIDKEIAKALIKDILKS